MCDIMVRQSIKKGVFMLIMLYGSGGIGKTYLAGTLSEYKAKTLYLDCMEDGIKTLELLPDPKREVVLVKTFDEFKSVYEKKVDQLKNAFLVIDSITELQEIILRSVSGRKDIFSPTVPSIPQYNSLNTIIKDVLRDLKVWSNENNVIVIILAGETVMEKRDIVVPDMKGKLGFWVVSAVNACVRLDMDENGERILHLKDHENESGLICKSKTRCNDEETLEEPTMKKLISLINGKGGAKA